MNNDYIKPGQIRIKNTTILIGLMERRYSPILINIIVYIANRWGIFITESYREKRHRNDLHGTQPVRAIDGRDWCYEDKSVVKEIVNEVNNMWVYDPNRSYKKVILYHKVGTGVMHLHIQVHPNTIRKGLI